MNKLNAMIIVAFDSREILDLDWVTIGQTVYQGSFKNVQKSLRERTQRKRPDLMTNLPECDFVLFINVIKVQPAVNGMRFETTPAVKGKATKILKMLLENDLHYFSYCKSGQINILQY